MTEMTTLSAFVPVAIDHLEEVRVKYNLIVEEEA
jgi:hypothetical protein